MEKLRGNSEKKVNRYNFKNIVTEILKNVQKNLTFKKYFKKLKKTFEKISRIFWKNFDNILTKQ